MNINKASERMAMMIGEWEWPQKVWYIHRERNKDGRGCESTLKGVLRALERLWRVSEGSVHGREIS